MGTVEQIATLSDSGYSQRKIAKTLGISRWKVQKACRENSIQRNAKDYYNAKVSHMSLEDRAKEFDRRLKERDNTKEYYSDYTDGVSKVKIRCLTCGTVYEVGANIVRTKYKKIYRHECARLEKQKKERELAIRAEQKKRLSNANKILKNSKQLTFNICECCGELFIGDNKYCTQRCRNRNSEHRATRMRLERAKENGYVDYTISLDKLIKRDNNICYICNRECNRLDYTYKGNTFVAGNYYPSIDHVIPLAKGGTHEWENVKLAHRICNSLKRDL